MSSNIIEFPVLDNSIDETNLSNIISEDAGDVLIEAIDSLDKEYEHSVINDNSYDTTFIIEMSIIKAYIEASLCRLYDIEHPMSDDLRMKVNSVEEAMKKIK